MRDKYFRIGSGTRLMSVVSFPSTGTPGKVLSSSLSVSRVLCCMVNSEDMVNSRVYCL